MEKEKKVKKVWQKTYKDWFGLEKDFSALQIPKGYNPRKHFAVIVAKGLTVNQVISAMRNNFRVDSLHEEYSTDKNDRDPSKGDYIVLFKKIIGVKNEDRPEEVNHQPITLMERLLLEVLYFRSTKKHLDTSIEHETICRGTVSCIGFFNGVCWKSDAEGDRLSIGWGRGNGYDI